MNDQKNSIDILHEHDLETKKLSEDIYSYKLHRLVMEDNLLTLKKRKRKEVTLRSKITKLEEDLKTRRKFLLL